MSSPKPSEPSPPAEWPLATKHLWVMNRLQAAGVDSFDMTRIFWYVARYPGKSLNELCQELGMTKSTAGRLVSIMASTPVTVGTTKYNNLHLLENDRRYDNRRELGIELAAKGRRLLREMADILGE